MAGTRGRRGVASAAALACALLLWPAAGVRAQDAAGAPARVFGVELERAARVDRLLVLAQGEVQAELVEESPDQLVLRLLNATLDARAARQVVSGSSAVIRDVAMQASAGPPPVVEIRVKRAAGLRTELTRRGAIVALEVARPAEPAPARPDATVRLTLRDRPLVDLVREVQRITQRGFVWDERLEGNATVIVQDPVTPGEALEILHATLLAKGFAAVPAPDGTLLVLPLDEARARAPRAQERSLARARAGLITVLTRFRAANAEQLVNLLAPFAGGTLQVVAYAPTNGAVLVGPENAIHRWLELARALDETGGRELVVIRPRHRTAAELYDLLGESVRDPFTGRLRAELFLDERTNALVVRADAQALAQVRAQAAELDAAPADEGEVLVIQPRFADPEKLAAQLEAAAGSVAPAASGPAAAVARLAPISIARHPSTRSLLITADAATRRALRALADALDTEPPLIAVEVNVLEVATIGRLALGFDAFIPTTDPSNPGRTIVGLAVGDPFDQQADPLDATFIARYARDPVVIPVVGPGGVPVNVTLPRDIVQLKAAEGEARVQMLMQPRLVALSGEEHEFSAGLNVPIPVSSAASAEGATGNPLQTRVNVERQDVGLRLRIRPTAGEEGSVRVAVDLEVTALQPGAEGTRTDVGPELAQRTLQATTRVENGGVSVLASVLERSQGSAERGVPMAMDAPVLGNLLRQSYDRQLERTLVLTLQARILRSADERLADTIRVRTAHERALARAGDLSADGAWALRVATRARRADAEALAQSLGEIAGRRARVVAWRWEGAERFDVAIGGFAAASEAAAALPELETRGWLAELVPVPQRE
jgi:general secretion pathway protein D